MRDVGRVSQHPYTNAGTQFNILRKLLIFQELLGDFVECSSKSFSLGHALVYRQHFENLIRGNRSFSFKETQNFIYIYFVKIFPQNSVLLLPSFRFVLFSSAKILAINLQRKEQQKTRKKNPMNDSKWHSRTLNPYNTSDSMTLHRRLSFCCSFFYWGYYTW